LVEEERFMIEIPRNPLLMPDREVSEKETERIAKYGDLATCDLSLDQATRRFQVVVQDPTEDEDALVLQTTYETAAGTMLATLGAKLMNMGKTVKVFDGK
jgi:hypothetical protein